MAIPTPVAYWKFDESSGNATDEIGSVVLTNNNTVGYASAKINNGADFGTANTNKTFNVANQFGLTVDAAKSFAGWVNISTSPASGTVYDIIGLGYSANDVAHLIEYGNLAGTIRLRCGRARYGVDDPNCLYTTTLTVGTWYHIALTVDGSRNQELYLNGTSVATSTAASGNGSFGGGTYNGTKFGTALFGITRTHCGLIDEWGIWNVQLTASEVSELYNGGAGTSYPFGGGAAPTPTLMMMGVGT